MIAYDEYEKIFKEVAFDPSFHDVFGSCYVTINETHFIQTGGYKNESLIGQVFIFELAAQVTGSRNKEKVYLKASELSQLNVPRKYHGCEKGVINDEFSIIVAGGIGINGTRLKSVEYISLKRHNLNESTRKNDAVIFEDTQKKKQLTRKSKRFQKYHTFLALDEIKTISSTIVGIEDPVRKKFVKEWKNLPPMEIARSHFPTIIAANSTISIVGGKCNQRDMKYCNSVESFNGKTCRWAIDTRYLKTIRYNHNSAEIPLIFCHSRNSHSIIKDGFIVGS